MEQKIKQLQKEVERLKRREKIHINRIKRLNEENGKLAEEIETLEVHSKFKRKVQRVPADFCPICGGEIDVQDMGHGTLIVCKMKNCSFKKMVKN
jgi:hypothetical protein